MRISRNCWKLSKTRCERGIFLFYQNYLNGLAMGADGYLFSNILLARSLIRWVWQYALYAWILPAGIACLAALAVRTALSIIRILRDEE